MQKNLSEYTTEELVELWNEICKKENLWKFKNLENCWRELAVREEIYERNSYEREFYGRGIEYSEKVKQADENLLRWVLENGVENLKDRDPPTNWWWHLDLVARKFYPAQFFYHYPYLREIYVGNIKEHLTDIPKKTDQQLIMVVASAQALQKNLPSRAIARTLKRPLPEFLTVS